MASSPAHASKAPPHPRPHLYIYSFPSSPSPQNPNCRQEARARKERGTEMMKLRSRRLLFKNGSKHGGGGGSANGGGGCTGDIKWELRPGGMLVQKREDGSGSLGGDVIRVRVSTGSSQWHDVSVEATSTFGELKVVLSLVTGLEARAQRLVYRGKEREDTDHLHMVGVGDMDKVLLLEDPAAKERKLHALRKTHQVMDTPPLPTIKV